MKIHSVIRNILSNLFECRACEFVTDNLTEVAEHTVHNQFVVKSAVK
jgi:hypothetical protein